MISFRTRGNFIDFVLIEDTTLQDEHVLMSLHNTSKAIDWSYDENPLTITFTINEKQYSNIPISSIDFDGTTLTTQAGFETNIESMFPNLAGGEGGGDSGLLVYKGLLTHTATDAPVVTVLQNTLGGNVTWSRVGVAHYRGTSDGLFSADGNKNIVPMIGGGIVNSPFSAGAGLIPIAYNTAGYYSLFTNDANTLDLKTFSDLAFTPVELSDILGGEGNIYIELNVYP